MLPFSYDFSWGKKGEQSHHSQPHTHGHKPHKTQKHTHVFLFQYVHSTYRSLPILPTSLSKSMTLKAGELFTDARCSFLLHGHSWIKRVLTFVSELKQTQLLFIALVFAATPSRVGYSTLLGSLAYLLF